MTRQPTRALRTAAMTAVMSLVAMMALVLNPAAAQAAPQPPLPNQCGLDVALVLDASGSIGSTSFNQARQASKDFVNVLEGTPSGVGVYTFASSADVGNAKALTSVASGAGATEVRSHIDAITYTNGGSTNWQAGFDQVPRGVYDIIIFVTDGYPNAGGDYVAASDAQKSAGAFVIALGVGSNINAAALQSISGPTLGTDYFMISNYSGLTQALQDIASATCAGTVSIVKETQDSAGNVIDEKSGWTFSAADATPTSGQTDSNGALNFAVDFSAGAGTKNVTITETQKPGWALQQQALKNALCTVGQTVVTVTNVANGFTIPVSNDEVVTCKVVNKQNPPSLSVEQTITPSFVRDYDWTLAKSLAGGEVATKTVPVGSSASFNYVVTATPAHTDSGWQIAGVATLTNPGAAAVTGALSYTAPAGINCSMPSTHTVPALDSLNVNFTCVSAAKPAAGSIASTVSWSLTDGDVDSDAFDFDSVVPTVSDAQITVSDDLAGTSWDADAADGVFTKNYTLNHTVATLACVPFTNTATLTPQQLQDKQMALTSKQTVTVCGTAKGVAVSNQASGSFDRDHDWTLTKTVDQNSASVPVGESADFEYTITATPTTVDSDFELHGQVTVTNSNAITLSGINVTVSVPGGTCTVPGAVGLTIPAGGNAVLAYNCDVPTATAGDTFTTTATVEWEGDADPTTTDTADADATVDFTTVAPVETDAEVVITDDLAGDSWRIRAEDGVFTQVYVLQHEATGLTCEPFVNTAEIEGVIIIAPQGLGAAAVPGPVSTTVTVCGTAPAVTIDNHVAGDFDRDHDWTLTKSVNTNNLLVTVGHQSEATYTLTATPSSVDSNFRLNGTTVVTNENAIDVSGVTVTVTVPDGTCVVVDGAGLTVPAGGSATLTYTCTLTTATAGDKVTTVATVVWEGDHDPTTVETDDGSAAADFTTVTPTETDAEVVLTDDLGQLSETLKASDGPQVITYDLVWSPTVAGCVAYPNVASITDDGVPVTSVAEVMVCAIKRPSALPDTGNPIGQGSLFAGLALGAVMLLGSRLRRKS